MINHYIITSILLLCFGLLYPTKIYSQSALSPTISTSSSLWTVPIQVPTQAGTDYSSTEYTSSNNQFLLNVGLPFLVGGIADVAVQMQTGSNWNNQLVLSIKRTGYGEPFCLLCGMQGAENYITITTTPIKLFSTGKILNLSNINNIPFQLKLTGTSVTIPSATYQATIVFTISTLGI